MSKQQLSILIPKRVFETSNGEIALIPFKFKQFPQALKIVERYVSIFTRFTTTEDIVTAIFEKVEEDYRVLEDIGELIVMVSDWDSEKILDLQYDEIFGILTEVIDQNIDFFGRIGKRLQKPETETAAQTIGEQESAA